MSYYLVVHTGPVVSNVPSCSTYWIHAKYGRHLYSWMYPRGPSTWYKPSMAVICILECSLVFHVLDTRQVWPSSILECSLVFHVLDTRQVWLSSVFLNVPPWSKYWIQAKYGRHLFSWMYPRVPRTGYKPSMAVICSLECSLVFHVLDTRQVWPSSVL